MERLWSRAVRNSLIILVTLLQSGCIGTVVGTATDVVIEVAKVPFKVGGAVIDVATDDDEEDAEDD